MTVAAPEHRLTWLLCDYGEVLSRPQPDAVKEALVAAAGLETTAFWAAYWEHRPAYDRGDLTVGSYWSAVLGRAVDTEALAHLVGLDVAGWMHPDLAVIEAAGRARHRGLRLALFSNAPIEVADAIDRLEWLADYERRFFSCRLRSIKPEPESYRAVLDGLGAAPGEVYFLDDRPANVAAAMTAGLNAAVFRGAAQIDGIGAVP